VVSGSRRIRASVVCRKIFETGFREKAADKDRSTRACAGHWRLILYQESVSGFFNSSHTFHLNFTAAV
jgi:hypothetical protein